MENTQNTPHVLLRIVCECAYCVCMHANTPENKAHAHTHARHIVQSHSTAMCIHIQVDLFISTRSSFVTFTDNRQNVSIKWICLDVYTALLDTHLLKINCRLFNKWISTCIIHAYYIICCSIIENAFHTTYQNAHAHLCTKYYTVIKSHSLTSLYNS